MPRRRKTADRINPNATKANTKFGWCTTGHHTTCRTKYTDWNNIEQECNCSCHKEK